MMLVAVSGWGNDDDRQKSIDAGFNAHITKPVDIDVLLKLIGAEDTDESHSDQPS